MIIIRITASFKVKNVFVVFFGVHPPPQTAADLGGHGWNMVITDMAMVTKTLFYTSYKLN